MSARAARQVCGIAVLIAGIGIAAAIGIRKWPDVTLTSIKFVSIFSSAVFGMLALLVDYKDAATRRISTWGKIALLGVAISAVLATSSEIISNAMGRRAAERRSLEYQTTLNQIRRAVMPLNPKRVDISFSIPSETISHPPDNLKYVIDGVSLKVFRQSLGVECFFLVKHQPDSLLNRINFGGPGEWPKSDYSFVTYGSNLPKDEPDGVGVSGDQTSCGFVLPVNEEHIWGSGNEVVSLPDLPKTQFVLCVTGNSQVLKKFKLESLIIRFGSCQLKFKGLRQVNLMEDRCIYTCDMPDDLAGVLALQE